MLTQQEYPRNADEPYGRRRHRGEFGTSFVRYLILGDWRISLCHLHEQR